MKFRLNGIPVEIKYSFLLLILITYGWAGGEVLGALELLLWVFAAVMLHELGHAWAYRRYGLTPAIELYALGGVTYAHAPERALTPRQELVIAAAGPAMSLLLGGVLLAVRALLGRIPSVFLAPDDAAIYPLFFSLGWGLLNLLPMLPLDGGQIMKNLLAFNRRWDAERIAVIISLALGGALLIWLLARGSFLNAAIAGFLIYNNITRLQFIRDGHLRPEVEELEQLLAQGRRSEALARSQQILASARSGTYQSWAFQVSTALMLETRQYSEAAELAARYPKLARQHPEVQAAVLRGQGDLHGAVKLAREAYAVSQEPAAGALLADLLAELGQDEALRELLRSAARSDAYPIMASRALLALMRKQEFAQAASLGQELMQGQRPQSAALLGFTVALAEVRLGRFSQALSLLRDALANGLKPPAPLEEMPELAPLHGYPGWEELVRMSRKGSV